MSEERYGRRKISKMLAEWDALRHAVAAEGTPRVQAAFDACEEWIDFAFGRNRSQGDADD